MNRINCTVIVLTILIGVGAFNIPKSYGGSRAIAVLFSPFGVSGVVRFSQKSYSDRVWMNISMSGMTSGWKGFHLYEKGDLSRGCESFSKHYNPLNKSHGAPWDENRHAGDFGSIYVGKNGKLNEVIFDSVVTLYGEYSIIGRGIVFHNGTDDLGLGDSSSSILDGNSGTNMACGVIGIQ